MKLKQTILTVARALGVDAVARAVTRRRLRILCYHGIWVTPGVKFGNCTFIEPEQFERRMARLKQSGLPVLPLGEAVERLAHDDLPDAAVAITVDDGWVSTLTRMLPVLEAHGLPATVYVTSWYSKNRLPVVNVAADYLRTAANRPDIDLSAIIAEIEAHPVAQRLQALRDFGAELGVDEAWLERRQFEIMAPDELAQAHRRGLDIQLHTHRHIEVATRVDALPQELAENRAFLTAAIGEGPFEHFCFPSGSFHPGAREMLVAGGVRSATLTHMGLNAPGSDPYALRRLLDCRNVSDVQFDSYLAGTLHFTAKIADFLAG